MSPKPMPFLALSLLGPVLLGIERPAHAWPQARGDGQNKGADLSSSVPPGNLKVAWTCDLAEETTPITLLEGVFLVKSNGRMYGLDQKNGAPFWVTAADKNFPTTPASETRVIGGKTYGRIYGAETLEGFPDRVTRIKAWDFDGVCAPGHVSVVWNVPLPAGLVPTTDISLSGNELLFCVWNVDDLVGRPAFLVRMDKSTGAILHSTTIGRQTVAVPKVASNPGTGLAYVINDGGDGMYAVGRDGKVAWKSGRDSPRFHGPVVARVANNRLYVMGSTNGDDPNVLVCLDGSTGAVLWGKGVNEPSSRLVVSGGRVYAITHKNILAFDPSTGNLLWLTPFPRLPLYGHTDDDILQAGQLLWIRILDYDWLNGQYVKLPHLLCVDPVTGQILHEQTLPYQSDGGELTVGAKGFYMTDIPFAPYPQDPIWFCSKLVPAP